MTRRQRRLVLIGSSLAVLGVAVGLVLFTLKDAIVFFNSPTDIAEKHIAPGTRIRLGGLVKEGSVVRGDNLQVRFDVTDGKSTIQVAYQGLLPDLFREGQGVVTEVCSTALAPSKPTACSPSTTRATCRRSRRRAEEAGALEGRPEACGRCGTDSMIPEIGHYALVLALGLALIQSCVPIYGARRNDMALMGIAGPAAVAQFFFVAVSFGALTICYVTSDFSVVNVFENSHSAKPLIYKISGVWGNHEGSMMLWVLILSVFGMLVAIFGTNLPIRLRATVLAVQSWVAFSFYLFILMTSNPFLRLDPAPSRVAILIRSCKTPASRFIRRCSISAMSAFRSRSRLRSRP